MSKMSFIAWRFLWKGTEQGRLSSMTVFSWLAIGVGVAAMSCLLSVMYGFEGALKTRVLNAYPHLMLKSKTGLFINYDQKFVEKLKSIEGIQKAYPILETEMILQSDHKTIGGVIWGVSESYFSGLRNDLLEGKRPIANSKVPQVIVGSELASRLGISTGNKIRILSPIEKKGAFGMVPYSEVFEMVGSYASGHYEFDQGYLYMLIEDAGDLMHRPNQLSSWYIWAKDLNEIDRIQKELEKNIPNDLVVQNWEEFNSALFQSLKLEQMAMFTVLSFALVIAVMNVVITLMMHVAHKKKNIGVLRALGASENQIKKIFIWQGAWMGLVGLGLGAVLTVLFIIYVKYFSTFQLPDIYYDRSIPIEIRPMSLIVIYTVATILIFISTIYPAKKASLLSPIEAVRE